MNQEYILEIFGKLYNMKTLKNFICEKLNKPIKEGEILLNISNGEIIGTSHYTQKYLDAELIENDYLKIEKDCKRLKFDTFGDKWDDTSRKLMCIILSQVKYSNDWKKMEKDVAEVAEKYSNIGVYKVKIIETQNNWDDISGNLYFDVRFNRSANLVFNFFPEGYERVKHGVQNPNDLEWKFSVKV